MNSLEQNSIPGFTFSIFKRCVAEHTPFLVERGRAIPLREILGKRFFKTTAKDQSRPRVFFRPAVEVTQPIATGTTQVLADLGIAIGHYQPPHFVRLGLRLHSARLPVRTPQDSETRDQLVPHGDANNAAQPKRSFSYTSSLMRRSLSYPKSRRNQFSFHNAFGER